MIPIFIKYMISRPPSELSNPAGSPYCFPILLKHIERPQLFSQPFIFAVTPTAVRFACKGKSQSSPTAELPGLLQMGLGNMKGCRVSQVEESAVPGFLCDSTALLR